MKGFVSYSDYIIYVPLELKNAHTYISYAVGFIISYEYMIEVHQPLYKSVMII